MKAIRKYLFLTLVITLGCDENEQDLPTVEERTTAALGELREELTDPPNGWKVNYQPTPESGSFLLILKFAEDGTLNIQSDVAADDGDYLDQTTTYRLDVGLGLELIFESYGVLHYLFELDQATFGAEFEFVFEEEDDGNLYFVSKSDGADATTIVLEPAGANDVALFSREIAENFDAFAGQSPILFGGVNPSQQLYFPDQNISIFWSVDLDKRSLQIDLAGAGSTIEEVLLSSYQNINQSSGYTFQDGKLILDIPVSINTSGQSFQLSEIALNDFAQNGIELCAGSGVPTPSYTITLEGQGSGTLSKNLINSTGFAFAPQSASIYSVNIPFVFNSDLESLSEEGSIAEKLSNAIAFVFTLGFDHDTIPENSAGFLLEYEEEVTELYLRSFDYTQSGNLLEISFTDEYYHEGTPLDGEQEALEEITDEIFEGGSFYAYELEVSGLTAFQLYNPCNGYEFVLVQ